MKSFAVLLFLVLAMIAAIAPEARGLQVAQQGAHLRHLQDQPDDQGQPDEQPGLPNDQPEQPDDQQQPGMPIPMPMDQPGADQGGAGNNEILVGGCFPGSWNWPRCRFGGGGGCFPGSWNWPRCRYGGGRCFPGSWNWPRCRYW